MIMDDCIFCKIANKKIPSELLYEDDLVAAFNDINPITPVHVLIVPKKHIESVADMEEADEILAGRLIMVAKKMAEKMGTSEGGYKLLLRVRPDGGQEVPHVHMHLLGGGKMLENIKVV
jgi:histidine triad (HIT) family protein